MVLWAKAITVSHFALVNRLEDDCLINHPVCMSQSQNKSNACKSLNLPAFDLYVVKSQQIAPKPSERFS